MNTTTTIDVEKARAALKQCKNKITSLDNEIVSLRDEIGMSDKTKEEREHHLNALDIPSAFLEISREFHIAVSYLLPLIEFDDQRICALETKPKQITFLGLLAENKKATTTIITIAGGALAYAVNKLGILP